MFRAKCALPEFALVLFLFPSFSFARFPRHSIIRDAPKHGRDGPSRITVGAHRERIASSPFREFFFFIPFLTYVCISSQRRLVDDRR